MNKIYKDNFGNTATIEGVMIFPYKGARKKENGFRLSIKSDYDNNFLYHVSVHETEKEAELKMREFSCNTWKEINK